MQFKISRFVPFGHTYQKHFCETFNIIIESWETNKICAHNRHAIEAISFRKFYAFFLWNFVLLFFQPNFFKKFSERNDFNCVPVIRTYFLVSQDAINVLKFFIKQFLSVCDQKAHIKILRCRNFGVPLGHIPNYFWK